MFCKIKTLGVHLFLNYDIESLVLYTGLSVLLLLSSVSQDKHFSVGYSFLHLSD